MGRDEQTPGRRQAAGGPQSRACDRPAPASAWWRDARSKARAPVNVLSHGKRLEVLTALVNGNGASAASRITGVHRDTIGRFGFAVGVGCERLHDRLVRDLSCPLVDMDEQHSWCSKRQVDVDPEHDDVSRVGERWTWAAICRVSRLIIAWHVGKRDAVSADALVRDVRARLVVMPQIIDRRLRALRGADRPALRLRRRLRADDQAVQRERREAWRRGEVLGRERRRSSSRSASSSARPTWTRPRPSRSSGATSRTARGTRASCGVRSASRSPSTGTTPRSRWPTCSGTCAISRRACARRPRWPRT